MGRSKSTLAGFAAAALSAALSAAGPAAHGDQPALDATPDAPKTRATLMTEQSAFVAGQTNYIGVRIEIAEGWHVYWPGQNDTGFALTAEWTTPSGITVGERWRWPAPERYVSAGDLLDHVFHDELLVMIPVAVPLDRTEPIELSTRLDWLVCREVCIFEGAEASITVPVVPRGSRVAPTSNHPFFEAARERWARPPTDAVRLERDGISATIAVDGASRIAFYPSADSVRVSNLLGTGSADAGSLSLELSDADAPFGGVVEAWDAQGNSLGIFRLDDPPRRQPNDPSRNQHPRGTHPDG